MVQLPVVNKGMHLGEVETSVIISVPWTQSIINSSHNIEDIGVVLQKDPKAVRSIIVVP
jgi:hypothetical protein